MKELYEITQIQRKGAGVERARGAAWAALGELWSLNFPLHFISECGLVFVSAFFARSSAFTGSFDAASLANVVDISGGKLLETFMGLHKDEVKGCLPVPSALN